MKTTLILAYFLFFTLTLFRETDSQVNDQSKYHTVYLEDLCTELQQNKDALLLDVRSPGEYDDTSSIGSLNIGRFKNSINIETPKFEEIFPSMNVPKDKKIYVYCSHSNRSRVCSDYLVQQGYTNVYNVNGGMSDWVLENINCDNGLYTTNLKYKLFPPEKVKDLIDQNNIQLIDLRPKDEYEAISSDENRNVGRLKNSINIPMAELESRLGEIDKNKNVILYDLDSRLSPAAAKKLTEKGYTNIGIMIFGLTTWINRIGENNLIEKVPAYKNLTVDGSVNEILHNKDLIILDVRSEKDYSNQNEMVMMRIGHLKNAINIPAADLDKRITELSAYKDKKILVYDNVSGMGKSSEVCKKLVEAGFKDVNNMFCGLYKLTWNKKNIKGFNFPDQYIINEP